MPGSDIFFLIALLTAGGIFTTRCVVCPAYINPDQEYFVLRCDENYLYFDIDTE